MAKFYDAPPSPEEAAGPTLTETVASLGPVELGAIGLLALVLVPIFLTLYKAVANRA